MKARTRLWIRAGLVCLGILLLGLIMVPIVAVLSLVYYDGTDVMLISGLAEFRGVVKDESARGASTATLRSMLIDTMCAHWGGPPWKDRWGREVQVDVSRVSPGEVQLIVRSAGWDGRLHTKDDLVQKGTYGFRATSRPAAETQERHAVGDEQ